MTALDASSFRNMSTLMRLVAVLTEALDLDISPSGLLTGLTEGVVVFVTSP